MYKTIPTRCIKSSDFWSVDSGVMKWINWSLQLANFRFQYLEEIYSKSLNMNVFKKFKLLKLDFVWLFAIKT